MLHEILFSVARQLLTKHGIRRVESTPDPDIFEKYRDTPPIFIAILLPKYALLLAESSIYTPPICIAIRLPFLSRYFCRSIRVRGRWDTPNGTLEASQKQQI